MLADLGLASSVTEPVAERTRPADRAVARRIRHDLKYHLLPISELGRFRSCVIRRERRFVNYIALGRAEIGDQTTGGDPVSTSYQD